jgi:hypothetical protein
MPAFPAEPALLALQRSAGNRAVARLVYDEAKETVTGSSAYAGQRIPWNTATKRRRKGDDSAVKPIDPTLIELAKDAEIRKLIAAGLGVDRVMGVRVETADALKKLGQESTSYKPVQAQLGEAAASDTALVYQGTEITKENVNERVRKVMRPMDYFPEPDDLAGENPNMDAASVIAGKTNWQLACTLIALYVRDGIEAVKKVTKDDTVDDDIRAAVLALHNHYVRLGVQYDDSASRYPIMQEWGYRLIFNGESTWADLNQHVALKGNERYVFDIDGHTVMVSMKRDYGPRDAKIERLQDVFECHSHSSNYSPGAEFNKKVLYIWRH